MGVKWRKRTFVRERRIDPGRFVYIVERNCQAKDAFASISVSPSRC